ncbi:GSCOCG00009944001-RA-CDS [Cotesia congregata]|nr:GSCOCG00009944001-RA-CDS [Cotesia congregata]
MRHPLRQNSMHCRWNNTLTRPSQDSQDNNSLPASVSRRSRN